MNERVVTFGAGGRLVGTLCLPDPPGGALAQVLFNAGVVHRVGPHRINVRLARRLAGEGIASLRFDLSGLGDSGRAPGTAAFEAQAVLDLREAMDCLERESGARRFALFGFCSGGRHAYRTASVDARVAGIVLHDTFAFATRRSRLNRYRLRLRRDGLVEAVRGRLARLLHRGEAVVPTADGSFAVTPAKDEFIRTIAMLLDRGTSVALSYSGEGDNYNYEAQFRDAFRGTAIEGRVALHYLPEMDHNAMILARQSAFLDRLAGWTVELAGHERAAGR